MAERAFGRRIEWWLPAVIVILDQATKAMVRTSLPLHESVTIVPGLLDFTHVRNTGAAFGMLNDLHFPGKTLLLSLVATGALVAIAMYSAALAADQLVARIGLALISGGAAGNLIDRIAGGSVVDFIDAYWGTWHFWTFNIADAAITVGVTLMLFDMLFAGSPGAREHAG
ncbi:MAG: signal peptidase II [Vicinamibacterales bacterium]